MSSAIDAANAARVTSACEKHWDRHKGDCSGFVKAVAAELGLHLAGQANDIADTLAKTWSKAADGKDAAAKAQAGNLVIGALAAQPNGHVVVVVDGPLNREKYPSAYWGTLGGTGRKNATINWSWSVADRDKVEYFHAAIATSGAAATAALPRIINHGAGGVGG